MDQFRLKREKYDVYDAGFVTVLFVVLQNLFLSLYHFLPSNLKAIPIIGIIASFGIEFMFGLAGLLTSKIRNVDFFRASKLNKKINWPIVGFCALIAIVSIYGFNSLSNYFIMMLETIGYKTSLSNIVIDNIFSYVMYVVLIGVVPAVFEEICFRGTICAGLESKNKHLAVFVSAFLFMIMHGGPEQTIHQFILGVVFGYIFVYTGNLWITILIHFFNNTIAVTLMYIQSFMSAQVESGALGSITSNVDSTLAVFSKVGEDASIFIKTLTATLDENRTSIKASVDNMNVATKTISNMSAKLDNAISAEKIQLAVDNTEKTTESIVQTSENIAQITSDIQLATANLNQTMARIDSTLCEINGAASNVNAITAGVRRTLNQNMAAFKIFFGKPMGENKYRKNCCKP